MDTEWQVIDSRPRNSTVARLELSHHPRVVAVLTMSDADAVELQVELGRREARQLMEALQDMLEG